METLMKTQAVTCCHKKWINYRIIVQILNPLVKDIPQMKIKVIIDCQINVYL